jgi:hypothetical protein
MKKLHLFSWSKDNNREFNDTFTWDSDDELKHKTDNFHDQKNRMCWENVQWSYYTTDKLSPKEEEIIGVQYGTKLKKLE